MDETEGKIYPEANSFITLNLSNQTSCVLPKYNGGVNKGYTLPFQKGEVRKKNGLFVVQLLSCVWLFVTPWTAASQASLFFTISQILLKLMSTELVMPSNHLIFWHPLLLLPLIFPNIRVFSNESAVRIRWPKYKVSASASVLPMNIKDWLPKYDWLIWSLCCPRDSQESSPASQFENINYLILSLLYGPTFTFVHDYWKNHSFDYMDLKD